MKQIPKPPRAQTLVPNRVQSYLQIWKSLFNRIDPEHVVARIKGEPDFPGEYSMSLNKSRLEDVCDLDIQLYIRLGTAPYLSSYGNEIYCCPRDAAFAEYWIYQIDANLDTVELVTWKKMYVDLVERRNDFYGNLIPAPPKTPD